MTRPHIGGMDDDFEMPDDDFFEDDGPNYRPHTEINMWELPESLGKLPLFGDLYMRMQANNIGLIDRWLMDVERDVLQRLIKEDRTPIDDAVFLNAQSQMWLFATYELLRTWRQRVQDVKKLVENGGLALKIESLEADKGYINFGKQMRAAQLRELQDNPQIVDDITAALKRLHIPYTQLEVVRVSLAKHEVRKKPKMPVSAPGYARIDRWTGSLSYEMGGGRVILGYITRRDISDSLRDLDHTAPPPTDDEIAAFDEHISQLGDETELDLPDLL